MSEAVVGEDTWTTAEIDEVVAGLEAQRAELTAHIDAQERELEGLFRDAGDRAGPDAADLGASSFERDHELTLVSGERDALVQIEHALQRVRAGKLGLCEGCGQAIPKMRVVAFPRATLCVSCKQREERR
ncbi:MAG TPA: TraR/DksA C4-type zinc finger protein [Nocardioides sp.]